MECTRVSPVTCVCVGVCVWCVCGGGGLVFGGTKNIHCKLVRGDLLHTWVVMN